MLVALSGCSGSDGGADPATTPAGSAGGGVPVSGAPAVAGSAPVSAPDVSASAPPTVGSAPQITTTTVEPGAPTACTVLTLDELGFVSGSGRVFGAGVASEPQETPYGAHTACTWTTTKGGDATVRVSVWDEASAFDDARVQVGATGDVAVGDRAFSSTLSSIYAVAGGHTLFVQFEDLGTDPAELLAIATTLAQLAVGRL